jgi:Tfp pilus assembly protein PilN
MSSLLEKPRVRTGAATALSGTLPQVNLLPPEVRAARGLRQTQRLLALALVVVLAACVAVFGLSLVARGSASSDVVQAQSETSRLQAEQSKYAEVPAVLGMLDQIESARTIGMSTDVQWKTYIDAIAAVLPANVSIQSLSVTQASPMIAAPGPTNPLQSASIGQILLSGRSSTVPDAAAWIEALDSVPGFADAAVYSVAVTEDESGVYYTVSSSVQVTDAVYSHRFDATEGEG